MKRGAVYPGTFDPITNGHHDLVRRAASIFDRLVIGIAANPNKAPMFPLQVRVDMAKRVVADLPNVEVLGYAGLTYQFARSLGLQFVVRGLRAMSDFEFEFQLANMSRHLAPDIETVFLTPQEQFTFVSSTLVREIAVLGGDVSEFVHPAVAAELNKRAPLHAGVAADAGGQPRAGILEVESTHAALPSRRKPGSHPRRAPDPSHFAVRLVPRRTRTCLRAGQAHARCDRQRPSGRDAGR